MTTPPHPTPSPPAPRRRKLRIPLLLLAHPFELAIGVLLATSVGKVAQYPERLLDVIPVGLVFAWVALGTVGVLAITGGLLWRHRALGRAVEKAGLYLLAATMLAYAVVFAARLPFAESWNIVIQLGAIGAAAIFRAAAIRRTEAVILETLRTATADQLLALVDGRPPRGTR